MEATHTYWSTVKRQTLNTMQVVLLWVIHNQPQPILVLENELGLTPVR